jgi:hypothetical protein
MLTLKRFKALTDSYGADVQRWPEDERTAAETLLESSAQARALLADARMLDEALAAASATHQRNDQQDAALDRLRSIVSARIASSKSSDRQRAGLVERGWSATTQTVLSARLGWAGIATAAGLAVLAGLVVGSMYMSPSAPDNLLTSLQPAPIDNLGGLM